MDAINGNAWPGSGADKGQLAAAAAAAARSAYCAKQTQTALNNILCPTPERLYRSQMQIPSPRCPRSQSQMYPRSQMRCQIPGPRPRCPGQAPMPQMPQMSQIPDAQIPDQMPQIPDALLWRCCRRMRSGRRYWRIAAALESAAMLEMSGECIKASRRRRRPGGEAA